MANMIADALGGIIPNLGGSGIVNKQNMGAINSALQIYNSVKGSANPMAALQSMASTNPQIAKAMEIVNQNGGNPKDAFMKLAEQSGIDPSTILNLLK